MGQIINLISNLIISLSGVLFMIFVFKSSKVESLPKLEQLFIKVSLATLICGSLFSFLHMTTPDTSEIITNSGLALILLWATRFHFKNYK